MKLFRSLQDKGFRITSQRKNLLKQIGSSPQTAEEIFTSMAKKRHKIDLASVYRGLQFFVKERIIREVNFGDGKKRYEFLDENSHHHHVICDNCGTVEDIKMGEKELTKQTVQNSQFKIQRHTLEFFGLCANCQ